MAKWNRIRLQKSAWASEQEKAVYKQMRKSEQNIERTHCLCVAFGCDMSSDKDENRIMHILYMLHKYTPI